MNEENARILLEGISALNSLYEISHAVSTPKRFGSWADRKNITHIKEESRPDDIIYRKRKKFKLVEIRKMKGYGAYHVGSDIQRILDLGLEPLIIDCPRNRRFIFQEVRE